MKNFVRFTVLLVCLVSSFYISHGQELRKASITRDSIDPLKNYWGDINGFLDRQSQVSLNLIEQHLQSFPPALPEPLERKMALLMIDCILHYEIAPQLSSVQEFYHSRMNTALNELRHAKVEHGSIIWKLYDHGFIIRTASVTVAFDLIRGYSSRGEGFPISDEIMKEIVNQCDVLFISHRHGDHSDAENHTYQA